MREKDKKLVQQLLDEGHSPIQASIEAWGWTVYRGPATIFKDASNGVSGLVLLGEGEKAELVSLHPDDWRVI